MQDALKFLTDDDQRLLFENAKWMSYEPGEIIVTEGTSVPAICVVRKGTVLIAVAHLGGRVPLARLGPGEIFGEMSFVENETASASVIAHGDVEIEMIDRANVDSLLGSMPSFAARFYHSLALILSRRVRQTNTVVAPHLCWS